jgi:outer membrane receptor protein involved in Fe transport
VNINRTFTLGDGVVMNGYFSVQNLFNKTPPVEPTNTATPGLFTAGIGTGSGNSYGFDQVGRYFTIGARFAL